VSFEGRSTDELVRIAIAGGGFRLDADGRSTDDLIRIAVSASSWGVRMVFAGMDGRSTDDLVRIAEAGEGTVEFEGSWLRRRSS
jgi:DNA replication protein